jgi:hypothetical protein
MRPAIAIAAAAVPAMLLAGCTSQGGPMSTPSTPESRPSFQTMPPLGTPSGTPATPSPQRWQGILDDLAGRGVTGTPSIVSAESVTWNDSSLGCPKPGTMYSQVITPGLKVVVEADGRTFDYRFGRGDVPKLCSSTG